MSQAISTSQFQERLSQFTASSLKWCVSESEASTAQVSDAIELLLQDTARVSQLSKQSLDAIAGLQKSLKLPRKQGPDLAQVISSLSDLANEHEGVQDLVQPIIRSLQFQDRLRQNLENIQKMIPLWLKTRQAFERGQSLSYNELVGFGTELMKHTTMKSERDIIRKFIAGLEPEADIAEVNFF